MKSIDMILYPSTIEQLNIILDKLIENEGYIAKIGDIQIGFGYKDKNNQIFYIQRKEK